MDDYLRANWFSLVQSISILVTLLVTLTVLGRQMRQTRVANSLLVTQHHREIWVLSIQNESLRRIFEPNPDLASVPVTEQERMFANLIFLHMSASFKATQAGAIYPIDGMAGDLVDILSHPIPALVWAEMRPFHDKIFVKYVDKHYAVPPNAVQSCLADINMPVIAEQNATEILPPMATGRMTCENAGEEVASKKSTVDEKSVAASDLDQTPKKKRSRGKS